MNVEETKPIIGKDDQDMRCSMREKYLRAVNNLVGKQCTFVLYGGTSLTGIYRGADIEFDNILVEDLTTPVPSSKHSILRSSDILTMTFDDFNGT